MGMVGDKCGVCGRVKSRKKDLGSDGKCYARRSVIDERSDECLSETVRALRNQVIDLERLVDQQAAQMRADEFAKMGLRGERDQARAELARVVAAVERDAVLKA